MSAGSTAPILSAGPRSRGYDPAVRVVLQRVSRARVQVAGEEVGAIGPGLVALVGVAPDDDPAVAARLAERVVRLRLFAGEGRGDERSLLDTGGSLLVVSQFTLLADTRRGNRPSWSAAAPPDVAGPLVEAFAAAARAAGTAVAEGRFGAHMELELVNDGPVTLILDGKAQVATGGGESA